MFFRDRRELCAGVYDERIADFALFVFVVVAVEYVIVLAGFGVGFDLLLRFAVQHGESSAAEFEIREPAVEFAVDRFESAL